MKQKMLIEEKIIASVLCLMVVMVAVQVLSRYVIHKSLSYTEELVRYFFVWITFLGASAAAFKSRHLSLSGSLHILPPRVKKWLHYLSGCAAFIFTGLLIVFGIKVVFLQIQTGQTTAAMGLPMWIIGLAIPVCSVVFMVRLTILALGKGKQK